MEERIVSLNELKTHLRITETTDDTLLASLLSAAEDQVESFIGYSIYHGDYEEEYQPSGIIPLRHGPCLSVTSIEDEDGKSYENFSIRPLGILKLEDYGGETLTISYKGGYELAPEALKLAVKIIVESLYNRLGSHGIVNERTGNYSAQYVDDIPPTAKTLLAPYRRIRL